MAGLGFETARVLASIGAKLAVTARTQAGADDVVAKLKEKVLYGIDIYGCVDFSKYASCTFQVPRHHYY